MSLLSEVESFLNWIESLFVAQAAPIISETPGGLDVPNNNLANITSDMSTWPDGDAAWRVAQGIALAEGANVAGSVPDRYNNPGDISDWKGTYGSIFTDGSYVTTFPDKQTGWQKLHDKLRNVQLHISVVFSTDMTWRQFAMKWAGSCSKNPNCDWVRTVCGHIGVSPDSKVGEYLQ